MKNLKLALSLVVLMNVYQTNAQEFVKLLQPSMYSYFHAGQQLTDTTSRYFLGSRESAYLSNGVIYLADFNSVSYEIRILQAIDVDTIQGSWKSVGGTYEFFHIPLANGDAIIGSNSFECDILFNSLTYITREGEMRWHLDYDTQFPINVIDTIGFVAPDVIAVFDVDSSIHYFNFEGVEVFYLIPPTVYFNIIPHNGFYYGIKEDGVFKLNNQFEPVHMYPMHQPVTLHYAENGEFIVSSSNWSVLLNTDLNEVSINFSLANTLSVSRTTDFLWIVTPEGLYQTTGLLVIQKHFQAEPFEKMNHVWAYHDTVFVGSEYNGIYHRDIVIRKYGTGINAPDAFNVSISSMYIDSVIGEPASGGFTLRFDSVMVEVHNHGLDTITSLFINWDWRLYFGFCHSIYGEQAFHGIVIPPDQSKELQLTSFVTPPFLAHIDPEFCFWVDSINGRPDVWPEDNRMCFETEIINNTLDLSADYIFSVNPIPAYDEIAIDWKSEKSIDQLAIYTSHGSLVFTSSVSGNHLKVDIQDWVPGVYYILAQSGGQYECKMFIKQ